VIELHFAEPAPGEDSCRFSEHALRIWEEFLRYSDALISYRKELDLDIVLAGVPHIGFDPETTTDPMIPLFEAYERGKIVSTRLPNRRVKWITLCGHHSSIIPDRDNPVHFSSLGYESIGAMALFEGGVDFVTGDGQVIRNEQWKSAEDYFLKLLCKYDLVLK
jgi:hypothetical protein